MIATLHATPIRSEKELQGMRWLMMLGWIFIIGLVVILDWRLQLPPPNWSPVIWHATHATGLVISILIGWSIGYKRLIGPTGVVR